MRWAAENIRVGNLVEGLGIGVAVIMGLVFSYYCANGGETAKMGGAQLLIIICVILGANIQFSIFAISWFVLPAEFLGASVCFVFE